MKIKRKQIVAFWTAIGITCASYVWTLYSIIRWIVGLFL